MKHPENPRLAWPYCYIIPGLLAGLIFAAGWVSCEILQKIKNRWNKAALVETEADRQRANQLTEKILKE